MQMLHDTEIAGGKDSFSKKSNNHDNDNGDDEDVYYNWSDDDFISHNIGGDGAGNAAGTDATYIQNSDQMFESQNPILSEEECFDIIQEARDTIAQGLLKEQQEEEEKSQQNNNNSEQGQQQQQQRASSISNSQLGEARYVGIGVCVYIGYHLLRLNRYYELYVYCFIPCLFFSRWIYLPLYFCSILPYILTNTYTMFILFLLIPSTSPKIDYRICLKLERGYKIHYSHDFFLY